MIELLGDANIFLRRAANSTAPYSLPRAAGSSEGEGGVRVVNPYLPLTLTHNWTSRRAGRGRRAAPGLLARERVDSFFKRIRFNHFRLNAGHWWLRPMTRSPGDLAANVDLASAFP